VNVIIFDGYLGSGKTLGMSLLGKYFQLKSGCTLYSNYGVKDSLPFSNYMQFIDLAKQPSSIVLLDEAHSDLDARNFNTNTVKFFTHIIFYLRKLRTTIFFATPSIDNLDSRVRSICNLYCAVSKDKKHFYYDMFDLQRLKFLKRYKIKIPAAHQIAGDIYDTYNIVLPVEFPQDRQEFHNFIRQLKNENQEFYLSRQGDSAGDRTPSEAPEECLVSGGHDC
jgi:hypothetical protein